jgi:hypothetical protein
MPPWLEILLNVVGYAGFIGIAKYHKPSDETETGASSPCVAHRQCGPAGQP